MRRSNCAGTLQYVPKLIWLLFLRILDAQKANAREHTAPSPPHFTRHGFAEVMT